MRHSFQLLTLALLMIAATNGCAAHSGQTTKAPFAPPPAADSAQTVTLHTTDGWTIVGDLYVPKGPSHGAVILLHQRGGQASDWDALSKALQKAGYVALAIDQRGAGRSTQGPGPTGADAPWDTSGDIAAAIAFLKGKGPIGLAGASYGANNALIYAAAHPQQVKALVLLSPGANYHGLDALTPAKRCLTPTLILHDRGDSIADDGPQQINALLPGTSHLLKVQPGSEHGTALLDEDSTIGTILAFYKEHLASANGARGKR
ncbi:alpha/beta hydrolase [Chthonomonas calidirosea]|uniref:alpha/beta hydrolase n=1 Tax=Chthonomonas calidirosea TaxID=454171 RepID=UPI0006ECA54A|nr:alpha/beta fold hydrolase [Chthonomonas calidirosea]CEK17982.1 lysophospholipase [Chthonomonas calidirosea]